MTFHSLVYWYLKNGRENKIKIPSVKVIDQSIDTSDATGRLLFNMLGAIAQFETEIRAERQMDGIRNAKANGVHLGRRKHLTEDEQVELQMKRQDGSFLKTLMEEYNLSKASFYRYLAGVTVQQSEESRP